MSLGSGTDDGQTVSQAIRSKIKSADLFRQNTTYTIISILVWP